MKKLVFILFVFGLFSACKSKQNTNENKIENRSKDDYQKKTNDDNKGQNDDSKEQSKPVVDDLDEDGNSRADVESINGQDDSENIGGWSLAQEIKFIKDCRGRAEKNVGVSRAKEYCNCMVKKLKNLYASYEDMERNVTNMSQADISKMAKDCN